MSKYREQYAKEDLGSENSLISKNSLIMILILICIWALAYCLMGTDALLMFKWWIGLLIMGIGTFPLSAFLFSKMVDCGYFVSKIVGTAISGLAVWLICYLGVPFVSLTCVVVTLVLFTACWGIALAREENSRLSSTLKDFPMKELWSEEILFTLLFVTWGYIFGFRPQAFGTEKMMDFGFMQALMRSTSIPVKDIWYSDGIINYYYGGQYYCTFLTKLFFGHVETSYNIARAMIGAFAFVMPYSIVRTMLKRGAFSKETKRNNRIVTAGSILAGAALSFAGNVHYILFNMIIPPYQEMIGVEVRKYWFPDSTRYIGYVPDVDDKTIHEFPSYSIILGDMHAHFINILFVLPMIAILLSWALKMNEEKWEKEQTFTAETLIKEIFQPEILFMTVLIGIYQFTNFWDYPIYFGLAGLVILTMNINKYRNALAVSCVTIGQAAVALAGSALIILPFTLDFDSIFQGIGLCTKHTRFYQLVILWGLPITTVIVFILTTLFQGSDHEKIKSQKVGEERKIIKKNYLSVVDLFTIIAGIWGIVLILVPEVLYVKDIYGGGYSRSNTMFKFTYQGYMILAICMSYAIIRLFFWIGKHKNGLRFFAAVAGVLVIITCGYSVTSIRMWFGDVKKVSMYKGLDATNFIATDYPFNYGGINWVKENLYDRQDAVVLEANGTSYTADNMVSAMTGVPTVLGWHTHEWLWRNDTEDMNNKAAEIQTVYTSSDVETVREILDKYNVTHIFVGTNEWSKYNTINLATLSSVGELVYCEEEYIGESGEPTRIFEVKR